MCSAIQYYAVYTQQYLPYLQKGKQMYANLQRHPKFGIGAHRTQKFWKALGKALVNANYLKERQLGKGSFGSIVGK